MAFSIMKELFQRLELLCEETLMIFLRKFMRLNSTLQIWSYIWPMWDLH